jgi:RNA polymerase sigma-70 factor (ECF subfamily)
VFRTALRLTGDADDAADLAQETFCKALQHWHGFAGRSQPMTWLHQILLNCVRDLMRRRKIRAAQSLDAWALQVIHDAADRPEHRLERSEQHEQLRLAITGLPDHLRQTFIATVIDGYSYDETAELLRVPVGTVASRVYRARQQVTAAMQQTYAGDSS